MRAMAVVRSTDTAAWAAVLLTFLVGVGAVTTPLTPAITSALVCAEGMYGMTCNETCGKCRDKKCDKVTGYCTDCEDGYSFSVDKKCNTICNQNTYGHNCASVCGHCTGGAGCNKVNGYCPAGCLPGYQPTDPTCKAECSLTSWGQNCTNTCSTYCAPSLSRRSDKINGGCLCQPGYMPGLCQNKCNSGFWGQNCTSPCSENCVDMCDNVNGYCTCKPGYSPTSRCVLKCPSGKYGQNCSRNCGTCLNESQGCDHVTGNCTSCVDNREMPLCRDCLAGQWGPTCGQRCGHCGGDGRCDPVNGICLSASSSPASSLPCLAGWTSPTCTVKCLSGTYGPGCSRQCGHCRGNSSCRHDNGWCEEDCQDGYVGVLCQTKEQSLIGPIVGSVLGAGVLIALAIVFAVCYMKRTFKPETPRRDFFDMVRSHSVSRQQAETHNQADSSLYQNMPDAHNAGGNKLSYDRLDSDRKDTHAYISHAKGNPAEQAFYENTKSSSGKQNKTGTQVPPDATYGNVRLETPEATYGNMCFQMYGNIP